MTAIEEATYDLICDFKRMDRKSAIKQVYSGVWDEGLPPSIWKLGKLEKNILKDCPALSHCFLIEVDRIIHEPPCLKVYGYKQNIIQQHEY